MKPEEELAMRLSWLFLGGLTLAIPACAGRAAIAPPPGDFTLKAEVVEALEGGPVVLRVTRAFHGKTPVLVFHGGGEDDPPCAFSTPKAWDRIERIYSIGRGGPVGHCQVDPG